MTAAFPVLRIFATKSTRALSASRSTPQKACPLAVAGSPTRVRPSTTLAGHCGSRYRPGRQRSGVFCRPRPREMVAGRTGLPRNSSPFVSRVMLRLRQRPRSSSPGFRPRPPRAASSSLPATCRCRGSATFATPGVKIGLFCTTPMVPWSARFRQAGHGNAPDRQARPAPAGARLGAWSTASFPPSSSTPHQGVHRRHLCLIALSFAWASRRSTSSSTSARKSLLARLRRHDRTCGRAMPGRKSASCRTSPVWTGE